MVWPWISPHEASLLTSSFAAHAAARPLGKRGGMPGKDADLPVTEFVGSVTPFAPD
jgi:hypothetical protein